ncbi:pyridoxamine 5'-phosphate oxidase family protein [Mycolicibacterium diernhoferi]|uniref:Flavin-nucleotide-binding protein n=1 Tax=Mycolicibacterium diernhoferi TaxID=1801 RepID=A0A1Q4H887_9MYCO|nr:pyridoxamine 5'-phosphate oxidase family protein [Mycolicibacterium diernhoferi]OJZ63769.1 flavin-nucleotide-binding protein [Mycolicibacterium diernhoferi]OPE55737.1 flavin-nucleotide-binding protein [Mycolicibacterium diernhoferi]PEG54260.1 pyridoxamine 5'-phosphate oxidase family protein [Mycolicibacterium diernhoferi]QYL21513.1 pyridoxamine 5'-phosphate oxidase family protein [Mycolicibacterium diernhoferi]
MLGTLAPDEIEELLSTEAVGRIGCIHQGRPYVVPVCYVYQDGAVYGHTTEGMKWQAMRAHPDVCFEVEHVDTLNAWRSVIAWGRVEELDGADAEHGLRLLIDRLMPLLRPGGSGTPPPAHGTAGHAAVYRIRLGEKTGRYESPDAGAPAATSFR